MRRAFDGAVLVDVVDDPLDLLMRVVELLQGGIDGLVHDLHRAAAHQALVLDQGDVGLDARRVAVHHEGDGPRGRQHRGLAVLVPVLLALGEGVVPRGARGVEQVLVHHFRLDVVHGVPVLLHDPEHGFAVLVVTCKGAQVPGELGRPVVSLAGHQRRDGPRVGAAPVAVVGQAHGHEQRAEVGVTQAQLPEGAGVLPDLVRGVARVVDDDVLGHDHDVDGVDESHHVEGAFVGQVLEQVDRGQVARAVVQVHVLGTGVARVDAVRVGAGVPVVDGRIVLHARVAALPRGFRDPGHDVFRLQAFHRLLRGDRLQRPVPVLLHRFQEIVRHPDRVVGVLELDGTPRVAVQGHVPSGVPQGVGLALLVGLAPDELHHVGVVDVQDDHLGRPAGLAPRLDGPGHRVGRAHEGDGPGGLAARGEYFFRGADPGQVHAGARPALEDHAFDLAPFQDGFHGIVDRKDETRRALGRVLDAHVEPDRAVERGALVQDDLLQLVMEDVGVFFGREVSLGPPPAGDRVRHAVDHVLDAVLALRRAEGAPEILGHDDVGGQLRPAGRDLHVVLLEDDLAAVPRDGGRALLPFHAFVGVHAGVAVQALDRQASFGERRARGGRVFDGHAGGRFLGLLHQEFVGFFQFQSEFIFSHTCPL